MAQIGLTELNTEWKAFTDITTPEDDVEYFIQNRGPDRLLAVESTEAPTTLDGTLIYPTPQEKGAKYKKGNNPLWLRAFSTNCSVNISDNTAGKLWFEFMSDLVDDLQTPPTLSKTISGYDVEMVWDNGDMETLTLTPSVEKDGESAGTSSVWWVVKDENGNEVFRKEWTELTVEPTSEYSADITYIDGDDTYWSSIDYETDAETGLCVIIFNDVEKNSEPFGSAYLYIKCE